MLLLIAGLNNPLTAQPQYYNFNNDGSQNMFPWNTVGGKDVQLLYLAGDFSQPTAAPAGNIISIAFRVPTAYPLGPWTYNTLVIQMGQ